MGVNFWNCCQLCDLRVVKVIRQFHSNPGTHMTSWMTIRYVVRSMILLSIIKMIVNTINYHFDNGSLIEASQWRVTHVTELVVEYFANTRFIQLL